MDPYAQFQAAINASNGVQPGNIAGNYAASQSTKSSDPAQFAGGTAVVQSQNDKIAADNAKQAAAEDLQRKQDALDPSKAKQVLLPNGQGYAFYDGTGQPMSINNYSLLTGKTPAELLADSPSPKDQKFVADYTALQKFTNAWVNGDTQTLDNFRQADPKKYNQIISTYKTPADMVKAFTQHWSDYYGTTAGAQAPNTPTADITTQVTGKPDDTTAAALKASSLDQVLSPYPTQPKPTQSVLGSIFHVGKEHAAVNAYNKTLQSNPWYAYQQSLHGG